MALTFHIPASTGTIASIARSDINQETLAAFHIPLTQMRVWDAMTTLLPSAGANDDLGLVGGTFGSASPALQTGDLKAAGSTSRYARFLTALPLEYDDGQTISLRCRAQAVTTVADNAMTLDVECYKSDEAAGVGSDICATAAQSINSTTDANYDFTITPTGLVSGDVLDIRLTVLVNDAATGTAVIGEVGHVELLCDVRG